MCPIFVLENSNINDVSVKILEMKNKEVNELKEMLNRNIDNYKQNAIKFNGLYKPDPDESLVINNFKLPNEVIEAIDTPLSIDKLSLDNKYDLNLRALFISLQDCKYEKKIIFQRIRKQQILLGKNLTIFWDKDTFMSSKRPGVIITECIDAYYENGDLYFKSYYFANQVFNLSEYYREATDDDIRVFCSNNYISMEEIDTDKILLSCSNIFRKKVAYILDSKVLENNSIDFIIESSKKLDLDFKVKNNKLIFPNQPSKQREMLSYLANEIYKGDLSEKIYMTNSKRPLR